MREEEEEDGQLMKFGRKRGREGGKEDELHSFFSFSFFLSISLLVRTAK